MVKKNLFLLLFYFPCLINGQNKTIDSLRLALKNAKHDTTLVYLLVALTDELFFVKPDTVMPLCFQAIAIIEKNILKANKQEKLSYLMSKGGALNNIGFTYKNQGDIAKALDYMGKSLKIQEDIDNKKGIANSFNNIGQIFDDQGDVVKALDYYERSLKMEEMIGNKKGIAASFGNIGFVYDNQGDLEKAMQYYTKGLKIYEELNDKSGISNAMMNIGGIYQGKGDFLTSLVYIQKCLKLQKEIGDKRTIAMAYINTGVIYLKIGKKEKALSIKQKNLTLAFKYCDSSLVISKELGFPEISRNAEQLLAHIALGRENYKEALEHYKQFIILRDSIKNEETDRASMRTQLKYDFEKKAIADSVRVLEEKKVISAQLNEERTKSYALYGGLVLVLVFSGFMVNRFRVTNKQKKIIELKEKETQKQNEIISHQKELVEEKHREITDSINYAERIQRSFLASKQHLDANLSSLRGGAQGGGADYFILFKPKDVVSGDFYWSSTLSNGNFILATADSTGHGVPGAIMSLLNITSLEKAIETLNEPSEILNSTRKTIIERLKKDGSEQGGKDGMDASLTVYDFKNKKLIIAAANNPVWIVRSVTSGEVEKPEAGHGSPETNSGPATGPNIQVIEIKPDKMPVGKHDRDTVSFTQQEIELQTGDVVYTLTDGFPDQFGGEKGKKYMSKNLREMLAANSHLPMREQKLLLEKAFAEWVGNLEQVDDVTIIGVRV